MMGFSGLLRAAPWSSCFVSFLFIYFFFLVSAKATALYYISEKKIAYQNYVLIFLTHCASKFTQMITYEHINRNEGGREERIQWKQEKLKSLKIIILISLENE